METRVNRAVKRIIWPRSPSWSICSLEHRDQSGLMQVRRRRDEVKDADSRKGRRADIWARHLSWTLSNVMNFCCFVHLFVFTVPQHSVTSLSGKNSKQASRKWVGGLLLCKSWPEAGTFLLVLSLRVWTFLLSLIPLPTMLNLTSHPAQLMSSSFWNFKSWRMMQRHKSRRLTTPSSRMRIHWKQHWTECGALALQRSRGVCTKQHLHHTDLEGDLDCGSHDNPLAMVIFPDLFTQLLPSVLKLPDTLPVNPWLLQLASTCSVTCN